MKFKSGHIPWNKDIKGLHLSPETEFKKGRIAGNKKEAIIKNCLCCGKKFSVKPSLDKVKCCSRSCARKMRPSPMKGKKQSSEAKAKMRAAKLGIRGPNHWNWTGGSGTKRHKEMQRDEYIQWRIFIFERDEYTCQICKKVGGKLNAHHIKSWKDFPDLRYDFNNGVTVCEKCHYQIHSKRKGR